MISRERIEQIGRPSLVGLFAFVYGPEIIDSLKEWATWNSRNFPSEFFSTPRGSSVSQFVDFANIHIPNIFQVMSSAEFNATQSTVADLSRGLIFSLAVPIILSYGTNFVNNWKEAHRVADENLAAQQSEEGYD